MCCLPKNCQTFSSVMFASFFNRFYLPRLYSDILFATKPLAMGYLLFSVVWPMATFGYLLSYGRCSQKVAQHLATFCSSLDYLLFGSQRSSFMGQSL